MKTPPTKLTEGDHVALLVRWASDNRERYTQFAWKVIAIDPDDPRTIRVENCRGGRRIVTDGRFKKLPHREWITEPSWLNEEGKPINDNET